MSGFIKDLTKRCTLFLPKHTVVTTKDATDINMTGYRIPNIWQEFQLDVRHPAIRRQYSNIETYIVFKLEKPTFTLQGEHLLVWKLLFVVLKSFNSLVIIVPLHYKTTVENIVKSIYYKS